MNCYIRQVGPSINHMKTKFTGILAVLLLNINFQVDAQPEDELGSWYIYNGFYKLSPRLELFAETQFRMYEPINNIETFFIRPYLSYYFSKQFNLGFATEFHRAYTFEEDGQEKSGITEFRLTLQGMVFNFIDRTTLQHRYRLEQRWVDGISRQRARYRLQATIPIKAKTISRGVWFINMNNEIMMDLGPALGLSQNRTFLAPGYQFTKSLSLQVGYMLIAKPSANFHRMQFLLTHKLNLYPQE